MSSPASYPRVICRKLKLGSTQQSKTKTCSQLQKCSHVAHGSATVGRKNPLKTGGGAVGRKSPLKTRGGDRTYPVAPPTALHPRVPAKCTRWLTLGPSTGTAAAWPAELLSESKLGSHIRICKGLYTRCSP